MSVWSRSRRDSDTVRYAAGVICANWMKADIAGALGVPDSIKGLWCLQISYSPEPKYS